MYRMISIVKFSSLPVLIALLLPQSSNHKTEPTPLERLQSKFDVVSVSGLTPSEVAGQYVNPSEEQNRRTPPMGSEKLFVFPDKTYVFTFETDISPETISDKGTWSLDADILQLKSDKDITWTEKRVERRHILVRRRGHDSELFLVGLERQLPYFEQNAKDDPEFMFLLTNLKREQAISKAEAEPLRKKLLKEKWKPDFYH
jgi:hypothetical protein